MIFELNFETEEVKTVYQFSTPFTIQPIHFVSNANQDIFTVASLHDGFWVNLKKNHDVDIDELFNIRGITQIIYDHEDQYFYLLANKKDDHVGFFLIKFEARNPAVYYFIIMWKHLLEIGDSSIHISRGVDSHGDFKELVIGYKTININTYNILVQDLSGNAK
jgi:hypothetical protein